MREAVDISGSEDKTSPKLKRILPQLVLRMPCRSRALSRFGVVAAKQMQHIGRSESGHSIRLPPLVNQQRECDPRLLPEHPRIVAVSESDCGQGCSFRTEGRLVFAQLRDVFTAKESAVVPQKNQYRRLFGPQ